MVTQFLGQIVRGEPIHLVDGGHQKRSFADVSDGIDALQTIIANPGGVASGASTTSATRRTIIRCASSPR